VEGTIVAGHGGWVCWTLVATTSWFPPVGRRRGPWRPASGVRFRGWNLMALRRSRRHAPRCTKPCRRRFSPEWRGILRGGRATGGLGVATTTSDTKVAAADQAGRCLSYRRSWEETQQKSPACRKKPVSRAAADIQAEEIQRQQAAWDALGPVDPGGSAPNWAGYGDSGLRPWHQPLRHASQPVSFTWRRHEPLVGIDYGTCNSSVAWFNPRTRQAEVLRRRRGRQDALPGLLRDGQVWSAPPRNKCSSRSRRGPWSTLPARSARSVEEIVVVWRAGT